MTVTVTVTVTVYSCKQVLIGCLLLLVIYLIRRIFVKRAEKRERERDNMIRADIVFTEGMGAYAMMPPPLQPGCMPPKFDASNGKFLCQTQKHPHIHRTRHTYT
jgi:hypothetical protein